MKTWQKIKYFLPFLKGESWRLTFCLLFSFIAVLFNGISPYLAGLVTTSLANSLAQKVGIDYAKIGLYILVFVLCTLLSSSIQYLASWFINTVVQNTMARVRLSLSQKLDRLPYAFFDQEQKGDILSRLTNDVDILATALQQCLSDLLSSLLKLSFAVGMMFYIQQQLAWTVFIFMGVVLVTTKIVLSYSQRFFRKQQATLGEFNGFVQEQLKNFELIRSYHQEAAVIQKFKAKNKAVRQTLFQATLCSKLLAPLLNLLVYIFYTCIAFWGSLLCCQGQLALGQLQAFIQYIWQVNQPLNQLSQMANMLQGALAGWERILYLLQAEEEKAEPATFAEITPFSGALQFKEVSFTYPQGEAPALQHLNLKVAAGERLAIVGHTGAGKSTLVQLLLRFYEPQAGALYLDQYSQQSLSKKQWRTAFSYVPQEPWLFQGTVLENLQIACPQKTEAEIIEIAKQYQVHEYIMALPEGYHTLIQHQSKNLSLGERQLLTILRAILKEAPILILDEATSSVDRRLEKQLQKAMEQALAQQTSIIIAHRLATIEQADCIIVLDQGKIAESGTHATLLAQNGAYAQLHG